MLGSNLAYYFKNKYNILGLYNLHPVTIEGIETQRVDLSISTEVKKVIQWYKPDIVIHCAALTDVDFCETNKEQANKINILGTKILVESIKDLHAKFVYISTDLVYDGKNKNCSETDPVNPLNYYGLTKYKGEVEAAEIENALILRTNIFGWNIQKKQSLAEWILHELSEQKTIKGFNDALFSSIYTFEFAKILDSAMKKDLAGIYNCGSSTTITKYDFAIELAECFNLNRDLIEPASIDSFDFKARRVKNLSLNVSKLSHDLDTTLPILNTSIKSFYHDYKKGLPKSLLKMNSELKC